jgi:hypothetical protein
MTPTEKFLTILDDDTFGILMAPTNPQLAIAVLTDNLLGENYYIPAPISNEQANTAIVHEILMRYSRKYRKTIKRHIKQMGK